ncbi:MAG: hypothetical protein KGM96_13110 [Acidobacteriota bacterium]|nr:hypothetical protein [Acidobacteriota bacterium]
MFEWLIRNKEWLFSGVGVPAVLAVAVLFRKLVLKKFKHLVSSPTTDTPHLDTLGLRQASFASAVGRTASLPSGNEIAVKVDNAPPYQRDQIGANYVGLIVSWPVIFFSLFALDEKRCAVTLAYGDETWGAKINVTVDIADYPRLKTAVEPLSLSNTQDKRRLTHGWIEGKIVKCGLGGMKIEPTRLDFFN